MTTPWSATATGHHRCGEAPDRSAAWLAAATAATELATATAGQTAIALTVGTETAEFEPALDDAGRLDDRGTRDACARLIGVVNDEEHR